jgi:hypothetical protein
MAKWIVGGLLALVIAGLGAPALAQCPAAGSLTVTDTEGIAVQAWINAFGGFSIAPLVNGSTVWFATQGGGADTFLVFINQTVSTLSPSITIRDLDGNIVSSQEYQVGSVATLTLSVAGLVAPSCAP